MSKKLVKLDELFDPISVITTPKLIQYLGVYRALKEIKENPCTDSKVLNSQISIRECEEFILIVLQRATKQINSI